MGWICNAQSLDGRRKQTEEVGRASDFEKIESYLKFQQDTEQSAGNDRVLRNRRLQKADEYAQVDSDIEMLE